MNQKEFGNEFKRITEKMAEIVINKNTDYSYGDDAFRNFKFCENLGVCSTEKGIFVRMSDKMTRIANLLDRKECVSDEKISDTLNDLAAYSIILSIYLKEKQKEIK